MKKAALVVALLLGVAICGCEQTHGIEEREETMSKQITVSFNGISYLATLEDNSSAQAFVSYLQEQGGSITISASDYGNFEKVAELDTMLPSNNERITTEPGDLILYLGNQIVLYYDTNSWNFTRLGKLEGDLDSLETDLGSGTVNITYSLNK